MTRFIVALKQYPALQNWLATTVVALLCFAFVAWYALTLTAVLGYQTEVSGGLLLLLLLVVSASAFRYDKIAKQLRHQVG